MRIVALAEHLNLPHMRSRVPLEAIRHAGWPDRLPAHMDHSDSLQDLGAGRLAAMDQAGISQQVLSVSGIGAELLSAAEAPAFAREYHDTVAQAVARAESLQVSAVSAPESGTRGGAQGLL